MWGGSLEVGGGEIEEGEEGGERATGRGDFSEGSSLMADSADVSVQNVVSHRGQFKVCLIFFFFFLPNFVLIFLILFLSFFHF